jgi:hypothetical protein
MAEASNVIPSKIKIFTKTKIALTGIALTLSVNRDLIF